MKSIRIAVLASGRGSNFEALAIAAAEDSFPAEIVLLVVDNPEAGALAVADERGIESVIVDCGPKKGSMSPEASEKMRELCVGKEIDLVCLAGFMRIVKGPLLDEYAGRIMNIHPAILPSFPGLHSQRQALEYGVKYSGCTVHYVDAGVDTGPVILQRVVPVLDTDDEERLSARILVEEHRAYPEAVKLHAEGRLRIEGRRVKVLDEA